MANRFIPVLTLNLWVILFGLHRLVPDKTVLYFSAADIYRGEIWRVATGHFMHADLQHLLWNCLGLALLGAMLEQHSRAMWWAALILLPGNS